MGMLGGGVQDNVCLSFTSMSANDVFRSQNQIPNPTFLFRLQTWHGATRKHPWGPPSTAQEVVVCKCWSMLQSCLLFSKDHESIFLSRWLTPIVYSLKIFFSLFRRLFGPDVSEAFLKNNDMRLVVRSHQCVQNGYQFTHSGNVRVTCVGEKLCFC